jgi:short-subunit dehydrogenase
MAMACAREGATVIMAARSAAEVEGAAEEIRTATGSRAIGVPCDVSVRADVERLIARAREEGPIFALISAAGIYGPIGPFEENSIDEWIHALQVNLFGTAHCVHAVVPEMKRRGEGRIINLSSVLGLIPAPYSAYYSATKHALEGYSESLDHEVRVFNIRVSLIEPAFTRSVFDQNALEPDMPLGVYDQARTGARALLHDVMPVADPPEIVAQAIVQAASATRPRRRYTAGKVARQISLLRRFAPAGMFDKSLRKQLRLSAAS